MHYLKRLIEFMKRNELIPTPFVTDAEYAVTILLRMSIVGFVITAIYASLWLLIAPDHYERALQHAIPFLAVMTLTYLLARQRHLWLGASLYLGSTWYLFTSIIISTGGVRAPFFAMYTLMILLVTLLLGWRIAAGLAVLTILSGFIMAGLDQMGYIAAPVATPMQAWLTHSLQIILLVGVTYFILHHARQTFQALSSELANRKEMEQALRESEERFRLISSVTSDYTFSSRFNAEGKMIHTLLTGAFEAITGYNPEEFIARGGWRSTIYPDDLAQDDRDMEALLRNERVITELRIIRKDGAVRWVRIYALPVWDDTENLLLGVNGGVQDITEQRQAAEALKISEKRHRAISELISDYAYAYKILPDGSFDCDWLTDESFTRMTGYAWQEIGTSFNLYHPEDAARAEADVASTIAGKPRSGEYRIITKSGEMKWIYLQRQVEWDEAQQRPVGYYGAARDISEQKNSAEALRRSEAHLRALLDATTDIAFLITEDGTFLTLNKTMADYSSETVDQLIGRNVFEMLRQELGDSRRVHFSIARETREPVRWEDTGVLGWWDNSVYPILAPNGEVEAFAVYSRDISEQKRLALELQHYTAQLEQMVEERTLQLRHAKEQIEIILRNTRDAIALAQSNGDINISNPAFLEMFGEEAARSVENILRTIRFSKEQEEVGGALLEALMEQKKERIEAQITKPDGSLRDIDLALIPVQIAADTSESGLLISAHDITHLKEIERFKTRFVADAVHDIATPIAALTTRIFLLRRSPNHVEEHVRALENQVEHLRDLLNDLRTLSQIDHGQIILKREPCSLLQILQRIYDTYEPVAISKQQTLTLEFDDRLPEVALDVRQIERAISNLVTNAIKYSPEGCPIRIRAAHEDGFIWLSVYDEGSGISAEELPRIFDRFYRARQARQSQVSGTGLGLAIAKEIFEMHGGRIEVESQPNQGTTFTVWLPLNFSQF